MISLFMDRQSDRDITLKNCYLQKLSKNNMTISFDYKCKQVNHEYFYWMIESIHNSTYVEFNVGMGIINSIDIVLSLGNAIHYGAKFTMPMVAEERIYPLYLFQNSDEHDTTCSSYMLCSRVDIALLIYEDAFQIRWGKSDVVRYFMLNDFLLMGLTEKDELVSITILQGIRKYISMDYGEFGDCLDVEIYPSIKRLK